MQYKVPQNVDMEDRVFGPLSLRQFTIILVGIGITIFLFFIMVGVLRIFFWFVALTILAAVFTIALGKYGSQTFEEFVFSAYQTFNRPRLRVWKKIEDVPQVIKAAPKKQTKVINQKKRVEEVRDDLNRLAFLVDSGGKLDIAEKDRVLGALNQAQNIDDAPDLLEKNKQADNKLDELLIKAGDKSPKREQLISEIAKLSPDKEFNYDKIETTI